MKHPHRDEWIPYLFGEADPDAKKQLAEHLNACSDCAEELHGWRKSLHRLDGWKMPRQKRRPMLPRNPLLNLAAAAVLVLGLGFGLGRWVSASADAGHLQARMERALKAALIPELRQQLQQELGSEWQARL